MSPSVASFGHLVHYLGFAMAIGGSFAARRALAAAAAFPAPEKGGYEGAAAEIVTKVELPGLFIALFGGILLVAGNPAVLDPARSGAGPWLDVKLVLVFILLVIAHLRMFRLRKLARERSAGATEAQMVALHKRARRLGGFDLSLAALIVFIATFRFVLFA